MIACPQCDKTFRSEAGLSYHTKYHHAEEVSIIMIVIGIYCEILLL